MISMKRGRTRAKLLDKQIWKSQDKNHGPKGKKLEYSSFSAKLLSLTGPEKAYSLQQIHGEKKGLHSRFVRLHSTNDIKMRHWASKKCASYPTVWITQTGFQGTVHCTQCQPSIQNNAHTNSGHFCHDVDLRHHLLQLVVHDENNGTTGTT